MFTVDVRTLGRAEVLGLRGELDYESVTQLHEAVNAVLGDRPELVIVDGTALTFCDSSGIGGLIRLYQGVSEAGGALRLAALPGSVARVVTLTGLDQVMTMHPDVADALAAGRAGSGPPTADTHRPAEGGGRIE